MAIVVFSITLIASLIVRLMAIYNILMAHETAVQLQLIPGITDAGNLTTTPYNLLNISPITSRTSNKEGLFYPQALKARSGPKYSEVLLISGKRVEVDNQITLKPGNTGFLTKREAEVYTLIEKYIRDGKYKNYIIELTAYEICKHLKWTLNGSSYKAIDSAIEKLTGFRIEHRFRMDDIEKTYRFSIFPEDISLKDLKNEDDNKYYLKPNQSYIKWVRATGKHTFNFEHYVKLKESGSRALFKYLSHLDNNTYTKANEKPFEKDLSFFYEDILGGHRKTEISDKFAIVSKYLDELKTNFHIDDYKTINIPGKPGTYKIQVYFFDKYSKMLPEYKKSHYSVDPLIEEKEASYQEAINEELNQRKELHDLLLDIFNDRIRPTHPIDKILDVKKVKAAAAGITFEEYMRAEREAKHPRRVL